MTRSSAGNGSRAPDRPADPPEDRSASGPEVTVRYWAALRAAAGRDDERVHAATLADLLEQIRQRHRDDRRFLDVVGICSVLVGERPVSTRDPRSVPLADDDVVELLPPFAGG